MNRMNPITIHDQSEVTSIMQIIESVEYQKMKDSTNKADRKEILMQSVRYNNILRNMNSTVMH